MQLGPQGWRQKLVLRERSLQPWNDKQIFKKRFSNFPTFSCYAQYLTESVHLKINYKLISQTLYIGLMIRENQ